MEKRIACVAALAVAGVMLASAKDASDGLVGWWRAEPYEDGTILAPAGLRDHVHASAAALVNHATDNGTYPAYPICHTNIDLPYPFSYYALSNAPCLYFPQPTNYNESGVCVANRQNIEFPASQIDLGTEPFTFIVRCKPLPRVSKNVNGAYDSTTICSFDYNTSANTGWKVCLNPQGSPNWSYLQACVGASQATRDTSISIGAPDGIWYELGVAFEPNQPSAGSTRIIYYQHKCINLPNDGTKSISQTTVFTTSVARVASFSSSRTIRIGDEAGSSGWAAATGSSRSFRGWIHEMKLYNRLLTKEEFEQACVPFGDPLFTIGSKNSSADEFSDETAVEVYDADSMPWYMLRKTLTEANPSLSIMTTLAATDLAASRVLELAPIYSDDCPQDAAIDVMVDGAVVERLCRNDDADRLVYISTNRLCRLTAVDGAYPLVISLRRAGGMGGTVSFDRIMLGGGWQLGKRDSSYGEFMTWKGNRTYNFFKYNLSRRDIGVLCGQMYGYNVSVRQATMTLGFSISDALAEKGTFVFSTRVYGGGTVDFYLNGQAFCTKTVDHNDEYSLDFDNGMLQGGMNELKMTWTNAPDKGVRGFDYLRLSPSRLPKGGVFIFR